MDRVGLGLAGDAEHLGDRQIGLDRPQPLADLVGLVGLEAVEGELVLLGEDRDRLQPSSFAARKTRMAISERFATRTFLIATLLAPFPVAGKANPSLVVRLRKQLFADARWWPDIAG